MKFTPSDIHCVLQTLNIEYKDCGSRLVMPCPIHGGDNPKGVSICLDSYLINNEEIVGLWKCWTRQCDETYGKTFVGFVNGVLSNQLNKKLSWFDTTDWIENALKNPLNYVVEYKSKPIQVKEYNVDRHYVRNNLSRPVQFLIDRGFSRDILDKYDIGIAFKGEMKNRVIVPVYDENYTKMVGCLGRTQYPLCEKCDRYHTGTCTWGTPSKWKNNFSSGHFFFNLWFAKPYIYEYGSIILVEGPLDAIRLAEAGLHSIAMFGASLKRKQKEILFGLPLHTIVIATDNDKAGFEARKKLEKQLSERFIIKHLIPSKKDWAEHSVEEIKECHKEF